MDTLKPAIDVTAKIEEIKLHMPETYKCIKAKAAKVGGAAYEYVRRGLRGEVNCFYAFEAGRVVGTPFNIPDVNSHLALGLVEFGCAAVCMFNLAADHHGAH